MKKNYISNMSNMIRYNLDTLIQFGLIFKILLTLILMPIAISLFNFTMKLTGYSYLTYENILQFLSNPFTLLLLLLIAIFLTLITLFDISTFIIIYDESYHQHKINILTAVKISLIKCQRLLKLKNINVIFLVLFLIPLLNIGISSNVISSIKIPEYILDYINANNTLSILVTIIYLFLASTLLKWLYSIHYMILEEKSFKEAKKASHHLIRKNRIKDLIKIIFAQLLMNISYMLFILIGIQIIMFINKTLNHVKIIESIFITLIWLFISLSLIIFTILFNGMNYAIISALFYKHKIDQKEKIYSLNQNSSIMKKVRNKTIKNIVIAIIISSILGGSIFTYQIITGKANLNIEYIRKTEVTAHRGASLQYPENTMAAFRGAKELGTDWIELDVQQTKDKQLVISHDNNLSRVAGINKDINKLTYEEIKKIDVGSHFGKKWQKERMPLLEEVLEFAKENNIRLNIEIKPNEEHLEKQVIEMIQKYNFTDRCVITSNTYSILENIKKIDTNIKTVYVTSIAIGNITKLKDADAFSIETTNINKKLVKRIHNEGKEIYAWTVNTEESINKMIDLNVDNIITDNITLSKELVIKSRNSNLINEFIKRLR